MRGAVKAALNTALSGLGLNAVIRDRLRRHLLVLCYHGVVAEEPSDRFGYGNTVSAEEFRLHLEYLARHFRPVSVDDVAGGEFPERAALVTFDDGYRNNLTEAAPVLLRAGVPCAFFVSTGYIGTRNVLWTDEVIGRILNWRCGRLTLPGGGDCEVPGELAARRALASQVKEQCKRLDWSVTRAWIEMLRGISDPPSPNSELWDFMTWDEVRTLHSQGFAIGSHTVNHPILTRIGPKELAAEMTGSKAAIERELGAPCRAIAYPNGGPADVSAEVFAAARTAGFEMGFTVAERHSPPGEDALSISRLCIQGHLPMSAFTYRVDGVQRLLR